jgi:hypothetical protein
MDMYLFRITVMVMGDRTVTDPRMDMPKAIDTATATVINAMVITGAAITMIIMIDITEMPGAKNGRTLIALFC